MRGRALASLALVAAGVSCAKIAPPPGGEIDREAPKVADCIPPAGAYGVAPDSALTITFSEPADRSSVMRALSVFPPVDFAVSDWKEARLRLVPEHGWATDRPTLVVIGGRAKDRHDNEMGKAFRTRFSTRAEPDTGTVTGRVWSGKEVPKSSVITMAAYEEAAGDSLDPDRQDPFALSDASANGEYRLVGLDTARRFHVIAMVDRDGDQRPSGHNEPWAEAPEMAVFLSRDENEIRLPDFLLGTLDSLGTISGEVRADSFAVAVVFAEADSVTRARDVLPGGGKFSLEVPTGLVYRVAAFLDVDGDSLPGPDEPRVDYEEEVPLTLTAQETGIRLDLVGLLPPPPADSLRAGAAADTTGPPPDGSPGPGAGESSPEDPGREEGGP